MFYNITHIRLNDLDVSLLETGKNGKFHVAAVCS
jgi:hypothetical protein